MHSRLQPLLLLLLLTMAFCPLRTPIRTVAALHLRSALAPAALSRSIEGQQAWFGSQPMRASGPSDSHQAYVPIPHSDAAEAGRPHKHPRPLVPDNVFHATHGPARRIGVLLVNLGSPESPTYWGLWKYLAEFLSDPRVVSAPRAVWLPVLYGFILPFRSAASAEKYRNVWTEEGSPLVSTTYKQAAKLQTALRDKYDPEGDSIFVEVGMRYGQPSVASGLRALRDKGVRRLVILPLYPQPSEACVTTIMDKVAEEFAEWKFLPHIRFVSGYADHDSYIDGLANSVRRFWEKNGRAERLVMSFHGIPADLLGQGEPYSCFCQKTARLLAAKLGLQPGEFEHVYQSRFGPKEWLQPYCDDKLEQLVEQGVKSVDVVCPGFAADCLETIDEVGREYAELFEELHKKKGTHGELRYIPCLNDSADGMRVLQEVAEENILGWVDTGSDEDADANGSSLVVTGTTATDCPVHK